MKSIFPTSNAQGSRPTFMSAVVRANDDPEKLGRVRVEYPHFHGDSAQKPSEWARVCGPYASKESGLWALPEVGDHVMVVFENGDLDHPVVLGAFYNKSNQPPNSGRGGDGKSDVKFIKTKSGHLICFDDAEKLVQIKDAGGNQITLGPEEIKIEQKGGSKVSLKNDKVVIQASGNVELGEGAAHALIKGDLFQQIFNAHTHTTGVGPSGPPQTPMTPDMLSQKSKTA